MLVSDNSLWLIIGTANYCHKSVSAQRSAGEYRTAEVYTVSSFAELIGQRYAKFSHKIVITDNEQARPSLHSALDIAHRVQVHVHCPMTPYDQSNGIPLPT